MENYFLERTHKTPQISAHASGEITLEGICIPENVQQDFREFVIWLNAYLKAPAPKTKLNVQLDYFNTSTASVLLSIFRMVANLKTSGKDVEINWFHDEDDSEIGESGHDFASIVDVNFNVIPHKREG